MHRLVDALLKFATHVVTAVLSDPRFIKLVVEKTTGNVHLLATGSGPKVRNVGGSLRTVK